MSSQNPFLWLPRQAPVIRAEDSAASESIVVTLTFKEIYGSQPTWNNLETELAPYSLERIVDVVCRINVLLYQAPRSWDPKTQHRVCQGLFGPAETPRVLQAALEFNKKRRQNGMVAPFLLFHEQQYSPY